MSDIGVLITCEEDPSLKVFASKISRVRERLEEVMERSYLIELHYVKRKTRGVV